MKRSPPSGSSPYSKHLLRSNEVRNASPTSSTSSRDEEAIPPLPSYLDSSQATDSPSYIPSIQPLPSYLDSSQASSGPAFIPSPYLNLDSSPLDFTLPPDEYLESEVTDTLPFSNLTDTCANSPDEEQLFPLPPVKLKLSDALKLHIEDVGLDDTANEILENEMLRDKLEEIIFKQSFSAMKTSLKSSVLNAKEKNTDRNYLLSLTPKLLCDELKACPGPCFRLICSGLLGLSDPEQACNSHYLSNIVALIFSTAAKHANRLCTGFALQLTTAARDGGLREDSIKLIPCFVHPRTSQKYDRSCLAKGWDDERMDCLKAEQDHFRNIHITSKKLLEADLSQNDKESLEAALRNAIYQQSSFSL